MLQKLSRFFKPVVTAIIMMCSATSISAEIITDSVTVYFTLQNADVDAAFMCNGEAMEAFDNRLRGYLTEQPAAITSVSIQGFVSPEGPQALNSRLCEDRARSLRKYASSFFLLPDSLIRLESKGIDIETLRGLVADDPFIADREDIARVLREMTDENAAELLGRLASYQNGDPYRYLSSRMFPWMRNARMIISLASADTLPEPVALEPESEPYVEPYVEPVAQQSLAVVEEPDNVGKPFYMAATTNMLYDAALIPNIGIEFYLGKGASIGANWMYAWWSKDSSHHYWRTYGGDIHLRMWLGKKAEEKPLTGHHLGLYAQMLTYDVEFGGKGYMGPRWSYGAGLEYGFSLPVSRRLNIDFSIGVGYLDGHYYKYTPIDGHYVWQATKKRHWVGPTKAEISLIWLIGNGNFNKKGGAK